MSADKTYTPIGYVMRAHGYKGNVLCRIEFNDPSIFDNLEVVFLSLDGNWVPHFTERFTIQKKDQALVKLEDIKSEEDARALIGQKLFLPDDVLPQSSPDSPQSWKGYTIFNGEDEFGVIDSILTVPGNPLASVIINEEEVFVPLQEELILEVDHDKKEIRMNLPEGLADLN